MKAVMPSMCHFWRMTPAEFYRTTYADLGRLWAFQKQVQDADKKALDKLPRR